ncbi:MULTISPECIES: helix-turn-helix domain-containing protein [unclassified Streptomyces]|uniref:helix-turn-helix domain-containing protein n=1 Tax=unclassified Streptomyces TaxID=2593676 RepID=UPI0031BA51D2
MDSGRTATAPSGVIDEAVQCLPAPALRPYIAGYCGYRQDGVPPTRHRGMPSPFLTLIFTLDDPLTVEVHPDPRQAPGRYDALLGGLHTTSALITHGGRQSGIQVALSPLGARALLHLPAGELANADIPADAVLGRLADEVRARLRDAPDWRQRFAVLDRILWRYARPESAVPPQVVRAWDLLLRSGGALSASALAKDVGWSGRHLAGRFHTEIGLSPKAAARVIRFDRARRLLVVRACGRGRDVLDGRDGLPDAYAPGTPNGLADLAADCGYFDQAHLAREFRSLAGCAPSRWLAEEFRNVQAFAAPSAAEWTSDEDSGAVQH